MSEKKFRLKSGEVKGFQIRVAKLPRPIGREMELSVEKGLLDLPIDKALINELSGVPVYAFEDGELFLLGTVTDSWSEKGYLKCRVLVDALERIDPNWTFEAGGTISWNILQDSVDDIHLSFKPTHLLVKSGRGNQYEKGVLIYDRDKTGIPTPRYDSDVLRERIIEMKQVMILKEKFKRVVWLPTLEHMDLLAYQDICRVCWKNRISILLMEGEPYPQIDKPICEQCREKVEQE